jgi:dihydrofolate reductase
VAVIVYSIAASLDGFIGTLEGGIDWLASLEGRAEDHGYAAFYATVDAVLVGGRTYDACLKHGEWPFPGKRCWVLTKEDRAARAEVAFTAREPIEVARELEAGGVKRAWLVGGGELAGAFRDAGLIDEYVISYVPVILGDGIPIFGFSSEREGLALVGSRTFPDGVVQNHYVRHPGADRGPIGSRPAPG